MLEIQNRIAIIIEAAERSIIEALIKRDRQLAEERRKAINNDIPEEDEILTPERYKQKWGEYDRIFTEQRKEYERINLQIQEITDTATRRYAAKYPTPASVYNRAEEVVNTFSLTLDRELFPLLGVTHSNGKLPNLEKPSELFIRMVFPDKSNREKNISDIFKSFSTHLEIENLKEVCRLKNWKSSRIDELIKEKATELYDAYLEEERLEERRNTLDTFVANQVKNIEYPVDKINSTIWASLEEVPDGQHGLLPIQTGRPNDKPIAIYYGINFDMLTDLTITKQLTPFDKRVYIAVSALFNAGNEVITLTQIHKAMGYTSSPNSSTLTKIDRSITKLTTARILLDNAEEAKVYDYPTVKYDGSLLPMERKRATINGKLSNAAIHLFREPPLVSFAKGRKQVTTFKAELLASPISKTDGNLAIEEYLIERIARIKNQTKNPIKEPNKILFETIYKNANIKDKSKKKRAPEVIKTYLEHYKECGFIKGYKISKNEDAVTIIVD